MLACICEQLFKVTECGTVDLDALKAAGVKIHTLYDDLFSGDRGPNALMPKKPVEPNSCTAELLPLEHYNNQEFFCDSNVRISFRRVKEITTELLPHGPAVDLDVYGWFQARHAQSQQNKE